ncbi:hypothetical protein DM01DRAFT_1378940 [Hesseltinella vesiculosa]|uniref:Uncharacterized protein n=1 Tax=Hesseltinella vesiculosa TaxID=101127 RepID=A0A1X2G2L7_9FUNG|nr:hypothetical protein DM01DRAFT_1378940 [Hesseltinella vesiculosa]
MDSKGQHSYPPPPSYQAPPQSYAPPPKTKVTIPLPRTKATSNSNNHPNNLTNNLTNNLINSSLINNTNSPTPPKLNLKPFMCKISNQRVIPMLCAWAVWLPFVSVVPWTCFSKLMKMCAFGPLAQTPQQGKMLSVWYLAKNYAIRLASNKDSQFIYQEDSLIHTSLTLA